MLRVDVRSWGPHPRAVALLAGLALSVLGACSASSPPPPREFPEPRTLKLGDADAELEDRIRKVVVGERARLRACYERGLARNAELAGRVVLVLEVGQSGTASRVFEARREGLGEEEVRCFAGVLKATRFHDGAARAVTIRIPLAFAKEPEPGT